VVQATGGMCDDELAKHFGPTNNTLDIAKFVQDVLATPNLETPLEAEIAFEMRDAIEKYEGKARAAAATAPKVA
jgi:ubiquitin-protein ligase